MDSYLATHDLNYGNQEKKKKRIVFSVNTHITCYTGWEYTLQKIKDTYTRHPVYYQAQPHTLGVCVQYIGIRKNIKLEFVESCVVGPLSCNPLKAHLFFEKCLKSFHAGKTEEHLYVADKIYIIIDVVDKVPFS